MSPTYHTPLPMPWTATASDYNSRLGELDAAIHGILGGELVWLLRSDTPAIPPTDFAHLYIDSNGGLNLMDDDGTITAIATRNPEYYACFGQVVFATTGNALVAGDWRTHPINTDLHNPDKIGAACQYTFTNGGPYQLVAGNVITGVNSGVSAEVWAIDLDSGSWADGDAAGTLWVIQSGDSYPSQMSVEPADTVAQAVVCLLTGQATDAIRLDAGTYYVHAATAIVSGGDEHQMRLYDTTNAITLVLGLNGFSDESTPYYGTGELIGTFTLTDTATVELQRRSAQNAGMWTYSGSISETQFGALVEIWMIP